MAHHEQSDLKEIHHTVSVRKVTVGKRLSDALAGVLDTTPAAQNVCKGEWQTARPIPATDDMLRR